MFLDLWGTQDNQRNGLFLSDRSRLLISKVGMELTRIITCKVAGSCPLCTKPLLLLVCMFLYGSLVLKI